MSEPIAELFALPYNQSIKIKSAGRNPTTSDAGVFLMRRVIDETRGLEFLHDRLDDPRSQHQVRPPLPQLLLQSLLQLGQGWSAWWNEQLSTDAAFAAATSTQRGDGGDSLPFCQVKKA